MEQNLNMIRPNIAQIKQLPLQNSISTGMNSNKLSEEEMEQAFAADDMLNGNEQNEVNIDLLNAGTISSVAAAFATSCKRQQQIQHKFEVNPAVRKRLHTRLIKKLKQNIQELRSRCGQQAVIVCVSPGKKRPMYHVFGSSPLDRVVRSCQDTIFQGLEKELQSKVNSSSCANGLFDLPPLTIDGMPASVDELNQAQLRMFIPEMLKYSLGRGKPGWGQAEKKPVWWPLDVPWANVRRDVRSQEAKLCVSWTQALRQIVRNCYRFHGREDLLRSLLSEEEEKQSCQKFSAAPAPPAMVDAPTLVQTVQNSDGSVSLVQVDSGQTIATICRDQAGGTVATLTNSPEENTVDITVGDMTDTGWLLANQDATIDDAFAGLGGVANDSTDASKQTGRTVVFAPSDQVVDSSGLVDATGITHMGGSAMVHIPISVYEKIARSIQQTGVNPTISLLPDGRLQYQADVMDVTSSHPLTEQRKKPNKDSYTDTRNNCDKSTEQLPT